MSDEGWAEEAELQPPFDVVEPRALTAPLVFNSPHSGAYYPKRFLAASRLDPLTLRRSEDAFVDELFLPCVALGAPLMRAHFPRAFLDLNREPFELDPQMFEGPLPDFANTRSLARRGGARHDPARRRRRAADLSRAHPGRRGLGANRRFPQPYHQPLGALIERAARASVSRSCSIAIPCLRPWPKAGRSISCSATALAPARRLDCRSARNRRCSSGAIGCGATSPMPGGFITEHYGAPAGGPSCGADRDQPRAVYGRAAHGEARTRRGAQRRRCSPRRRR